jgi:ribonuclease P protein component
MRQDPEVDAFQFGLITGKRLGNAVIRNRLRRQMREIIRAHQEGISLGWQFVTIARWRAPEADFADLEQDWVRLAKRQGLLVKQTRPETAP